MIKTPLFWKFGSNIIFEINKVWEANKRAKGEIEQKEELIKQHARMKCKSNGPAIKSLKMKHGVILTFLNLWDLFCKFLTRH
jgi:hypothetical protein